MKLSFRKIEYAWNFNIFFHNFLLFEKIIFSNVSESNIISVQAAKVVGYVKTMPIFWTLKQAKLFLKTTSPPCPVILTKKVTPFHLQPFLYIMLHPLKGPYFKNDPIQGTLQFEGVMKSTITWFKHLHPKIVNNSFTLK